MAPEVPADFPQAPPSLRGHCCHPLRRAFFSARGINGAALVLTLALPLTSSRPNFLKIQFPASSQWRLTHSAPYAGKFEPKSSRRFGFKPPAGGTARAGGRCGKSAAHFRSRALGCVPRRPPPGTAVTTEIDEKIGVEEHRSRRARTPAPSRLGQTHRRPIDSAAKLPAFGPGQQGRPGHSGGKTAVAGRGFRLRRTGRCGNARHVGNVVWSHSAVKPSGIARGGFGVAAGRHSCLVPD